MFIGSTQILTANSTFASDVHLTDRADKIAGIVKSDQGGTLHIEQSIDGTNWDLDNTITVTANTGASFEQDLIGSYVRLRYVNGGSNQTSFRLGARAVSAGDS
jgi:hypothetical protein